jgi:glycosyltransferase involved in cell wall biosynthesis
VSAHLHKEHNCRFQLFDRIVSPDIFNTNTAALSSDWIARIGERFFNYIFTKASKPLEAKPFDNPFPEKNPSEILLLFDPLYALYHELDDSSVVFVLDLTTHTMPQWHNSNVCVAYDQAFAKLRRSRCKIISISQSTTLDLRCNFGIQAERIITLPLYLRAISGKPATDRTASGSSNKYKQFQPYFLFVGSLEERKNIVGLIQAFKVSGLSDKGYSLLIAGRDGHGTEEIHAAAASSDRIHLLGAVDDITLDALYCGCEAFVYPSFWEGFGLPLLEAMARGIPCLSTETGASPEVGADAVIYADPCDVRSIAAGLRRLAELSPEDRDSFSRLSIDRANKFTFARFISGLENVLRSVSVAPADGKALRRPLAKSSRARLRAQIMVSDFLLPELPRFSHIHDMRLPDSFSLDYAYLVQQSARMAFTKFIMQSKPISARTFLPFCWNFFRNSLRLKTAILLSDALIRERQLLDISADLPRNNQR